MKIVIIAPGCMPIPNTGWGAIERIVWDYYQILTQKQHEVIIINTLDNNSIITQSNNHNPDIIHIMYDDHISVVPHLNCSKIFYTSHFAYLTHPDLKGTYSGYYYHIFRKVIDNKDKVNLIVISEQIKNVYVNDGFPSEKIQVLHNGARDDLFNYTINPSLPNSSVYVGKIEHRKGQYKYQSIPNIDFVGNYYDSPFNRDSPNYKGEWSKDKIFQELTNYANLVLLSNGEADPLVVKEALVAGLGVVISECSSANLDKKDFITIIPNDKLNDLEYVENKIIENRKISIASREEIREYSINKFGLSRIIDKYCEMIKL